MVDDGRRRGRVPTSAVPSAYSMATMMLQVCRVEVSEVLGEEEGDLQGGGGKKNIE